MSRVITSESLQNDIDELFGKNEYKILEEYKGVNSPIKVKHMKCGHIFSKKPRVFYEWSNKDKSLCPKCNGTYRRTHEEFIEDINKASPDMEIISDEPITNVRQRVQVRCKLCGKESSKLVRKLLEGSSCSFCHSNKRKKYYKSITKSNDKFIQELSEKFGDSIVPLETYDRCHKKMKFMCTKCGRIFKAKPNNLTSKTNMRCKCESRKHISRKEREVIDFIKENYDGEIKLSYKLPNNKEIDIYIPDKKIAFEFDGIYWHSFEMIKQRLTTKSNPNPLIKDIQNYHLNKTIECEEYGITLYHIFDSEWKYKNDIVKSRIIHLLGISTKKRIYANSKTTVYLIDKNIKKDFLEKNHIQGNDKSSINLGLFRKKDGLLLAVMTFCKPRPSTSGNKLSCDYELCRFATNIDYVVINAYDKLFAYFKENYKWNTLVSYADRRWSSGNIYNNTDWIVEKIGKPDYYYIIKGRLYHRYNFSKKKILSYHNNENSKYYNLFKNIDCSLSEKDIMESLNIYRIYDCGTITFKYTRKE